MALDYAVAPGGAVFRSGPSGLDGRSAYQLAVLHGFVGSETEYLASLHGDDGQDGAPGTGIDNLAVAAVAIPNETVLIDAGGGYCAPADPRIQVHCGRVVGFAKSGAPAGGQVSYRSFGKVQGLVASYPNGAALFIADGTGSVHLGGLTTAAPNAVGTWSQQIATASSASDVVIAPGFAGIIDDGLALVLVSDPATATPTANGLMSSTDKLKLDSLQTLLDAKAPILVGLTANGSADDRMALAAADALQSAGEWLLKQNGVIRISSNITLSAHYRIPRGVRFKPDSGVTITFAAGLTAGSYQIFDLSAGGAIAGLKEAEVDWFHNLRNTGTDCVVASQKAYDAVVNNGVVRWGLEVYTFSGGSIIVDRGQVTLGRAGRYGSTISWNTTATNGFKFTNTGVGYGPGPAISNMRFEAASQVVRAESGIAIFGDTIGVDISNINCSAPFDGIVCKKGGRIFNINIGEPRNTGIHCIGANDNFLDEFIIASLSDTVTLTNVIGVFQPGERITFSDSPFLGTLYFNLGNGRYRVNLLSGGPVMPSIGVTQITGQDSGAKGTISAVDYDMQLGGIRLTGGCESIYVGRGDVIGGLYPLLTDGSGVRGSTPGFNRFTDTFFDSSHNGPVVQKIGNTSFSGCWSYNHGNHAFQLDNTDGVRIKNSDIGGSIGWGIYIRSNNKNLEISSCTIMLNTVGGLTTVGTGNVDVDILHNKFNVQFAFPGALQPTAVVLNPGTIQYFDMIGNKGRGLIAGANAFLDKSGVAAGDKNVSGNYPVTVFA